jgi:exo-1,4-beta-D-glucosaminidase
MWNPKLYLFACGLILSAQMQRPEDQAPSVAVHPSVAVPDPQLTRGKDGPVLGRLVLTQNWFIKSTLQVPEKDENVSSPGFKVQGWFPATMPSTVLSVLVKNGVYPDPRIGMNNFRIPDVSDAFNKKHDLSRFSYLPDHRNPWQDPYWFRTEFQLPRSEAGRQFWVNFDGLNYRADVWLNGHCVANAKNTVGMFRRFKFNVTPHARPGETNVLAVKIHQVDHFGAPTPGVVEEVFGPARGNDRELFKDETMKMSGGWDCAPVVRDRNMGIYQQVFVTSTGPVVLEHPYIVTDLPLPDTHRADLSISAELTNTSDRPQTGVLKGTITLMNPLEFPTYTKTLKGSMDPVYFEKSVEIPPAKTLIVKLDKKDLPQLSIPNPHLWWPNGYGEQYLHNLELSYEVAGRASDRLDTTFGIRTITNELKEISGEFGRVFLVNGKRIFCRGGWIQPESMLEMDSKRVYDEARLMAEANMNMIGNEDAPSPSEEIMDSYDMYGLLVWETFQQCWRMYPGRGEFANNPLDHELAKADAVDIIQRYRNHPSLAIWCAANETTPSEDIYVSMRKSVKELDPTRPFVPSSNIDWDVDKLTPYIKPDLPLGMTDHGPPGYCWHPEPYYFNKILEVKEQMFRDELGVPSVPVYSSLKKFIPTLETADRTSKIFPLDRVWAEHDAWDRHGYAFRGYDTAIREMYGAPESAWDYAHKAQYVNATSYRAMFEAANHRMWDITSGIMLWKLNSCWPSVLWQLYDWYLNPNAAYYFTKSACEPLHVQLNANDSMVTVVNASHEPKSKMTVSAEVYDFDLHSKWSKSEVVRIESDQYRSLWAMPKLPGLTPVYFVHLQMKDAQDRVLSSNLYWLSSRETPDFRDLKKIESASVDIASRIEKRDREYVVSVTVKNSSNKLAFFKHLIVSKDPGGEEIMPVFWSDNFITLFPGDQRNLKATFAIADSGGAVPVVELEAPPVEHR